MTPEREAELQTALNEYESAWRVYGTQDYPAIVGRASRLIAVLRFNLDVERERNAKLERANYMLLGASYKADLDAERERNVKLERLHQAVVDERLLNIQATNEAVDAALAALEDTE